MIEHTQKLLDELEQREAKWRRRSFLYTFVPVLLAGAFIAFGLIEVNDARNEVEILQKHTDSLRVVDSFYEQHFHVREALLHDFQKGFESQLDHIDFNKEEARKLIQNYVQKDSSFEFETNLYLRVIVNEQKLDLRDTGTLLLHRDQSKKLLFLLSKLQNIPWRDGGTSPIKGFDTKGLVDYALRQVGGKIIGQITDSNEMDDGDIVNLVGGYRMFYFKVNNVPLYIGMTEIGVWSLRPSFAQATSFEKVLYSP